jgi:psiF repeat
MTRLSQKWLVMSLLSLALSVGIHATAVAPNANKGSSHQDKVKACNNMADRKSLQGDDRKEFMQDCLNKAGDQQHNGVSEKDKMDACKNLADRRNLTGNDRRLFVKDCMNRK